MADTISTSKTLGITINNDANNPDAKNQTIKLTNYKTGLTEARIKEAMKLAFDNELLIESYDEEGNAIYYTSDSSVVTAYTEEQQIEQLDIGFE